MQLTARAFRVLCDESRVTELLNRYEARYNRHYQQALSGFRAYRADRRKDEKEARKAQKTKTNKNTNCENAERSEPNLG
jgi:hypothetical protein